MSGKNSPSAKRSHDKHTQQHYVKGASRALDVVLSAAERSKLTDEETLLLVRAYRKQLRTMEESRDTEPPFLDRAVAASLKTIMEPVETATA